MAADVAGHSRLMGGDEGTLAAPRAIGHELVDPRIAEIASGSSRPPATARWSNSTASSMRCGDGVG